MYTHTKKKRSLFIQKSDIVVAKYSKLYLIFFEQSSVRNMGNWHVFCVFASNFDCRNTSELVSWSKKSHIRVPLYKLTWEQDWCTHWCKKIITITLKNVFLFTKTQVYLWVKWNRYLHIQINISVFMSK